MLSKCLTKAEFRGLFGQQVGLCVGIRYQFRLRLSPDLGRDPLVAGKQVMEIRHTLKEPRALTDPIRTSGHTQELQIRDLCWILANGETRENVCREPWKMVGFTSSTGRLALGQTSLALQCLDCSSYRDDIFPSCTPAVCRGSFT